jgi:hypothetical protein
MSGRTYEQYITRRPLLFTICSQLPVMLAAPNVGCRHPLHLLPHGVLGRPFDVGAWAFSCTSCRLAISSLASTSRVLRCAASTRRRMVWNSLRSRWGGGDSADAGRPRLLPNGDVESEEPEQEGGVGAGRRSRRRKEKEPVDQRLNRVGGGGGEAEKDEQEWQGGTEQGSREAIQCTVMW